MLEKGFDLRGTVEILNIEERIPQEHLLRKIDRAVGFEHIYDLVSSRYSADKGRRSVDPVVLFKIVLLQHLYGIPSLRQTMREIDMNMAYRWFLGYNFSEPVPHFATVSYAFTKRYDGAIVEEVFRWILYEVEKAGLLEPEVVFVDATPVKANANLQKRCKKAIPQAARVYDEQLRAEINADREAHGRKPFDDDSDVGGGGEPAAKTVTVSTTDPDAGLFHKGDHKQCFAYGAHTVCDRNNFILDVEVTAGNVHDSVVFDTLYERISARFPQTNTFTMDAGYKTPWIAKKLFDDGHVPCFPYRRPQSMKDGHKWYEYVYDEYYDQIICPEYKTLSYATTNREGYREYKSKPYICVNCPTRHKCTHSKQCVKTVTRHVWQDYLERSEDIRLSPRGKAIYRLRKETIERVFADAKEKHGMRYTNHRGLARVSNWVRLKFAAMNLKKLALWRWRQRFSPRFSSLIHFFYAERVFSLV